MSNSPSVASQPPARRVLVVDDHDVNRQLACDVLEWHGFACTQASTGLQAMSMIEAGNLDAVVLDIQLPDISGLALTALVRASANTSVRNIKVIAATALAFAEDRVRCLEAGCDAYLSRPYSSKDLVRSVREVLPATPAF